MYIYINMIKVYNVLGDFLFLYVNLKSELFVIESAKLFPVFLKPS